MDLELDLSPTEIALISRWASAAGLTAEEFARRAIRDYLTSLNATNDDIADPTQQRRADS